MTDNVAAWLDSLAARDDEFRASVAPVPADHVGDLSVVELQARLISAAEGNSLRDAIIRSQSARIANLSAELEQALATPPPKAEPSPSPTPLGSTDQIDDSSTQCGRRALGRVKR